ncbi:hypothetical protein CPB86DRAFT_240083 [Serendipita vermifera]|nr:hypothetical protein CPB86DRAFT_240083 [Serendipita vermifera]
MKATKLSIKINKVTTIVLRCHHSCSLFAWIWSVIPDLEWAQTPLLILCHQRPANFSMEPSLSTIPSPNQAGFYSTILNSNFESCLIAEVKTAAAELLPVNDSNAGQLLFAIQEAASIFSQLPKWNPQLCCVKGCEEFVQRRPEVISLLTQLYQTNAFAWLCENVDSIFLLDPKAVTLREMMKNVKVKVGTLGKWKRDDISKNDAEFTNNPPSCILNLVAQLRKKRPMDQATLSNRFPQQYQLPRQFLDEAFFIHPTPEVEFPETLTYTWAKTLGTALTRSPSSATTLGSLFLHSIGTHPYFGWRLPWNPVLLIEAEGLTARHYSPQSIVSVAHPKYGPFLMIEVVSGDEESDRWRMLLQSIAVCRFQNRFIDSDDPPVIVCAAISAKVGYWRLILCLRRRGVIGF